MKPQDQNIRLWHYHRKLEAMVETLRRLRDSTANPCEGEDVEGRCPCHAFDEALDHLTEAAELIRTL